MTIFFKHPDNLRGKTLDEYLEAGWFRMRQSIFTCRYLLNQGILSTAVWLRLPLEGYQFSRSLRKILRKNDQLFEYSISVLKITQEQQELYQRYQAVVRDQPNASLQEDLYEDTRDVYQSWQTEVRLNGKLIAFSVFDLGAKSMESISGIYDPDHSQYSLGIYTMLLEVRYAIEGDLKHYYIGYFASNVATFDYKLRLGTLEFLDPFSQSWHQLQQYERTDMPCAKLFHAYEILIQQLHAANIPCQLMLHPAYRFSLLNQNLSFQSVKIPLFVMCYPENMEKYSIIVSYQIEKQEYHLQLGKLLSLLNVDPSLLIQQPDGPLVCRGLMAIVQDFLTTPDPEALVPLLLPHAEHAPKLL